MSTEAPNFQPSPENTGREQGLYTPSSWEAAFEAEIQQRFNTSLREPSIDNHGRLVRVSPLVVANNKLLAFQYTRFDILKSQGYIYDAYTYQQSGVAASARRTNKTWDWIEAEMDEEDRVEESLTAKVLERDGNIDLYRALTEPRYYIEGLAVQRWPEEFEFVLFEDEKILTKVPNQGLIERHGKLNDKRPDIYGALWLPPRFEGFRHKRDTEGRLVITYPKSSYQTARAYAKAFGHEVLDSIEGKDFEIDDIDWFPESKPIQRLFLADLQTPQQIMAEMGLFIEELTRSQ